MDLSFPHPTPAAPATLPAADARTLAASLGLWATPGQTARVQAALGTGSERGSDDRETASGASAAGAFNPAMAARLIDWGET